ncbi:hypothetical protein [Desulfurobacterium indicum]|uniref:Uncharacterized protein n=1 Tax=Desulfurobacterium indicum TaxID=1914305 RepID=A0A1R1MLX9_9BACT|nr:hypothetical protein [Desulfurobacterium indicum]OMH40811.1 hypothetical protein BLW93_03205 [Desulfurobacterium indicum]
MDRSFSEYAREIIKYISETFPYLHFKGSDDQKIIKRWYHLRIPDKFVMKCVTEMQEDSPKTLKELGKRVEKLFKLEKKKERKEKKQLYKEGPLTTSERLQCLYDILQDVLLSLPVDNVLILEKLREISELDDELIEEQLEIFEDDFFAFLLNNLPDKDEILKKVTAKLERYRFYWDEKIYKITYKALVKKTLRERYEIPEFTIVVVD